MYAGLHTGRGDDERHMICAFKERLFGPQAVFAELIAVIAGEHDDGVFIEMQLAEFVEHTGDLRVHEACGG